VAGGVIVGGGIGASWRKQRRDDQDARAGGLHAQHDRPGGGLHRGGGRGRAVGLGISAHGRADPGGNRLELFLGAFIGAITFSAR
jgi:hypothetical protein